MESSPLRLPAMQADVSEKLQKVLARAGLGSRRALEHWIAEGRISVDGARAALGQRVSSRQVVRVDGRALGVRQRRARRRVLAYHKPEGELCTRSDPAGRETVFSRLPRLRQARWVAVGRLDVNSTGLLLLTTDGELAHRLMHPSRALEREYAVRVLGNVDAEALRRLRAGIELDGTPARFDHIRAGGGRGANRWYYVTIREGRKREVRRLWQAVGARVSRLIRVRYGPITLPRSLRPGQWQELEPGAVAALAAAAGLGQGQPRAGGS